jgi:hypothetical protein
MKRKPNYKFIELVIQAIIAIAALITAIKT